MGFSDYFRVEAQGHSGGIWLFWRGNSVSLCVVESDQQYIYAENLIGNDKVNLFVVYACLTPVCRCHLWEKLKNAISPLLDPVFVGGDFNHIPTIDECLGGNGRLSSDSLDFGNWVHHLSSVDLGFKGNKFTWMRGRTVENRVAKRLDCFFCCTHGRMKWQEAGVAHLPFLSSDHAPLYLQLEQLRSCNPSRRPFHFEAVWLSHPQFQDLLTSSWSNMQDTPVALSALKISLLRWNREVYGNIHTRKTKVMAGLHKTQLRLSHVVTAELLEDREEILWYQKSREKWIRLGDRDTSYFHTSTVIRRRRNRVEFLKNDHGHWIT
ncbi:hypothetical protein V2J09_009292 [Rumex salicifolius]